MVTKEEGIGGGINWESWINRYTLLYVKQVNNRFFQQSSNQSILKEISPEYSLEGLILKLKLRYCDHLTQQPSSLKMNLMLGKILGKRRMGWQRMRQLDSITNSMNMNLSKLQEILEYRGVQHAAVNEVTKRWTQLSD